MNNLNDYYNILGFVSFVEDGVRHYGCRGIGKDYDDFYGTFLKNTPYKCKYVDFPWDNFIFENIYDEQRFLKEYSTKIEYFTDED